MIAKRISILLADDHEYVRRGLKEILQSRPEYDVIAEAANGVEAVAKAKALQPDVALLDVFMPEMDGIEATRQIHAIQPQVKILILTMNESEYTARQALAAGATGYVLKSDPVQELVAAIKSVSTEKRFVSPHLAGVEPHINLSGNTSNSAPTLLSDREGDVLRLIAEGKTNAEVASYLNLSIKTVETHRTNMMRKLGVHSTAELVRYAVRNRIVTA